MQIAESHSPEVYARTVDDAARCIGISRAGLYRLIGAKQIRPTKIGHRTVVAESELRRFVAERMEATA